MPASDAIRNALIDEVIHRLYDENLPRILKCMDRLDEQGIWWRPNENSNSIGNLILHLCGNVRQWIYAGLGGNEDSRDRQTEFDERRHLPIEELRALLVTTMDLVLPVIRNVQSEELLNFRPVQTFHETGITILIHVTEHFSYHTGQIAYITKMLADRQLGFYEGVTLQ